MATNDALEVEAWWRFEAGVAVTEKRLAFRDDDGWVQWNRRRLTPQQLELKKWPSWPLSELAIALGLPGRDFLQRPLGLLDLSSWEFPSDVGANLKLAFVSLPDATALEIRQQAETTRASTSKVVEDAIVAAETASVLGEPAPQADRAPWDEDMPAAAKTSSRELPLFLTHQTWDRIEAKADSESLSDARVVEYAWRREHPFSNKPVKKK